MTNTSVAVPRRTLVRACILLLAAASSFASPPPVTIAPTGRSYAIAGWRGLGAAVKVDGTWIRLADFASCRGSASRIDCRGTPPLARFSLQFRSNGRFLVVDASATAASRCAIQGFRLLESENALPLPSPVSGWMLYGDGFNALEIGTLMRLPALSRPATTAWISMLTESAGGHGMAFAALSGRVWPTWFEWSPGPKLTIRAGGETASESITAEAGATVSADPVAVAFYTSTPGVHVLGEIAAEIARAHARPHPPRRPSPGWCSWMYHAGKVTERDVLTAADVMKERLAPAGYRTVQIDGGWWDKRGDWKPNANFSHGMRWLADEVHRRGLEFGLHMSPFRIDSDSELARRHPDWLLRTLDGKGLVSEGGRDARYVLDASHPDAVAWLQTLFAGMARDWNVDYFKLDFLNQGAREGMRHNSGMSGVQALAAGVRAIREAVPAKVLMLGCNLPTLAGYEYFDALRIGPDINRVGRPRLGPNGEFANMIWGADEPGQSLTAEARAVARQFFTHSRLFVNDVDAVLLTPGWPLEEARVHFTLAALSGGNLFLGDRLDALPAERLALAVNPMIMDLWREGHAAIPQDLFAGEDLPSAWRLERSSGKATVTAIFNWSNEGKQTVLPATQGRWYSDLWSGEAIWADRDRLLRFRLEPHSVRVIEGRPAR